MDEQARKQKEREVKHLGIWHVTKMVPFVLPEQMRCRYLDRIANGTGPVEYYQRVLRNNARYHQLSAELDGDLAVALTLEDK